MRKNFSLPLGFILVLSLLLFSVAIPLYAQDAPPGLIETAITAANESNPELGRPSNWRWEQLPLTSFSTLACPIAVGYDTGTAITPYRVTLTFASGDYVVHVSADTTQVQLCDVKFTNRGSGTNSATGTPNPTADPALPTPTVVPGACMLKPAGAYSNVRSRPSLDAGQLDAIYENSTFAVLGRNDVGTWFLIEPGWVASSVVELSGDCSNIPFSAVVIYGDTVTSDVSANPYPCPVNYAGYMMPRIKLGDPFATVVDDGVPNRLRTSPMTTAVIVGEVPSGNPVNAIVDGPACNEGYVWWLVEYGELGGWTAESNVASDEYYLEPWQPVEDLPDAPAGALMMSHTAGWAVAFSPSGATLASTDNDTGNAVVNFYNMIALHTDPYEQLSHNAPVNDIIFDQNSSRLVTGDFAGVTYWEQSAETGKYEPVQVLTGMSTQSTGFGLDVNPDWSLMAVTSCLESGDGGCLTGEIRIWDMAADAWLRTFSEAEFIPYLIEFRSDGSTLLAADHSSVKFWNAHSGSFLNTVPTNLTQISGATFSPDGMMVAVGGCLENNNGLCDKGGLELWNVVTMTLTRTIEVSGNRVSSTKFTPDGLYVAAAVGETVQVWGTATGLIAASLTGFDAIVSGFAFNDVYTPEAYQIATVDNNNILLVWRIALPTAAATTNG